MYRKPGKNGVDKGESGIWGRNDDGIDDVWDNRYVVGMTAITKSTIEW